MELVFTRYFTPVSLTVSPFPSLSFKKMQRVTRSLAVALALFLSRVRAHVLSLPRSFSLYVVHALSLARLSHVAHMNESCHTYD